MLGTGVLIAPSKQKRRVRPQGKSIGKKLLICLLLHCSMLSIPLGMHLTC